MAKTILLADDSVTIQKVVELTFMGQDYQVVAVSDGSSALAKLAEEKPDIVIADVHMPGPNGYEVTTRAKQQYPGIPVLLLVGTFEPFNEEEMRACGAEGHLKKPFDSQDLMREVERLVQSSSAASVITEETQPLEPIEELPVDTDFSLVDDGAPTVESEFAVSPPAQLDPPPLATPEPLQSPPGFAMNPPPVAPPVVQEDPFELPKIEEDSEDLPPLTLEEVAIDPETVAATEAPVFEAPSFQAPSEPQLEDDLLSAPPTFETPQPESAPELSAFETVQNTDPFASEPTSVVAEPPAVEQVYSEPEAATVEAETVATPAATSEAAASASTQNGHATSALADEDVDRIARRVVELLGESSVREVAWEVIPDLAELIIRERIRELESQIG